jgi:hypothetical protein
MIITEKQRPRFIILGKYYGYPSCCIDSFVINTPKTHIQQFVHKGLGFIPCNSCATKIMNGENTIEELIKNRICRIPFPNHCSTKKKRYCKLRAIVAIHNYYNNYYNN